MQNHTRIKSNVNCVMNMKRKENFNQNLKYMFKGYKCRSCFHGKKYESRTKIYQIGLHLNLYYQLYLHHITMRLTIKVICCMINVIFNDLRL